jgi:hypothetical protein
MFKQMRTLNLKFICATLFVVTFLMGAFLINITKVNAETSNQAFPYSLSSVSSYPNTVGGVTTVVNIGCVPSSGDKYDINTGSLCPYSVPGARMGCAKNSGDKYDVNTGKLCVHLASNVMIGCASSSKDLYDINTGKRCINNSVAINSSIVTKNTEGPGKANTTMNPILTEGGLTKDSTSDKDIRNNLTASGGKINSLFTWPMSTRTIALVVILILALAFGLYNFFKKDSSEKFVYTEPKNKSKEEVKPIVTTPQAKINSQHQPTPINTNVQPVKRVEQSVNTSPQNKIPDVAPLTHPQPENINPQMPLNISNNPNIQDKTVQQVVK